MTDLRNHVANNQNNSKHNKVTYIVKPDSLCQGKGIFLTRQIETVEHLLQKEKERADKKREEDEEHKQTGPRGYIVQQYIDRPHLIEGLKYDLRIYVFLYGVSPLRIYLHQNAFARFCTEQYRRPNKRNMDNVFIHLTNYALNKNADNYQ